MLDKEGKPTGRYEFRYGAEGEKGYLKWVARNHPGHFMALYGKLIPLDVNAKVEEKPVVRYETVEERRAAMLAKGWHPSALADLAQVNEKYQGTKVAGHPVVLTLLIDEGGTIDGLRIDTDPQARLFWRKKAHLLALVVKSRYGEEGWECHDIEPSGGETAVGGLFIKKHCEKIAGHRRLLLDRRLYRRPGQSMNEFVNERMSKFDVPAGGRSIWVKWGCGCTEVLSFYGKKF